MKRVENFFAEQLVNFIDKDHVNNTRKVLNTINTLGLIRLQRKKADLILEQLENPKNQ
jgi:hypothetical protein